MEFQREVPLNLSEMRARSMASQMTSADEGRAEQALGHAMAAQQLEISVLEVESAAEIVSRDEEADV